MKLTQWLLTLGLTGLLSGCILESDDDADVQYQKCSAPDANSKLYDYLQDWYFWYPDLPTDFNPSSYETVKTAMADIRDNIDKDRFSFALTSQEYEDYQASIFFGYGFSHTPTEAKDGLVIRYVLEQGSAAQNGLRRGDIMREVDGVSMAEILAGVDAGNTTLSEVFGPNEEGHSISVKFDKPNGEVIETQFSKSSISANTVMATQIKDVTIEGAEKKVGYLVFDSFDNKSEDELNTAFNEFALQNIDEMILDLRYNSGGLIRVAQQLSTQIGGDAVTGQVFTKYIHNDKQSSSNREIEFALGEGIEKMSLDRVVVLITGSSCSASELVINALSPFVEVITIGKPTCGKPVGMYPEEICDHVVFAINFQTQNAANFGDYFEGLPTTCSVADEINGDWGVQSDPLLSEGLYYLQNDSCRPIGSGQSRARIGLSSRRAQEAEPLDFTQGPWHAKRLL